MKGNTKKKMLFNEKAQQLNISTIINANINENINENIKTIDIPEGSKLLIPEGSTI